MTVTRDAIELVGRGVGALAGAFGGGPVAGFVTELFKFGAGLAELGASVEELRVITPAAVLKAARAELWRRRADKALDESEAQRTEKPPESGSAAPSSEKRSSFYPDD